MPSKSIHVAANDKISFIFVTVWVCHIFFIHLSIDGHIGCFHNLAIVNNAATNIGVHVSFWLSVLE